jgi:hypothetical protein
MSTAGPELGTGRIPDIVRLPFEFFLPPGLPPSFYSVGGSDSAIVSYSVEVVAHRRGLFRLNKRVAQILVVLPTATPDQIEMAMQVRRGWNGPWTTTNHVESVRKHFWNDKSRLEVHVCVSLYPIHTRSIRSIICQFSHPAVASFPIGIPIPISMRITTFTKQMLKSDTTKDAFSSHNNKPLFPPPPETPAGVRLRLYSITHLKAEGESAVNHNRIGQLGGFGEKSSSSHQIKKRIAQPVWISEEEGGREDSKGCWRREVQFDSMMALQCAPTFGLDFIDCRVCICHFPCPKDENG